MIYASMEIPKIFSIVDPQDDSTAEFNLDQENYFMAAAGEVLPNGNPNKHRQANVAANMISMSDPVDSGNGANGMTQSWFTFTAIVFIVLFNME